MQDKFTFDWSDLAFGSKKPLRELKATFIAAPRELSRKRFKQLVAEYLPKGNIVLGISKESYVNGFEDQPQFRMLERKQILTELEQIQKAKLPHKVYTLDYFQRELPYILEKITFKRVVLVNGSWQHVFHASPAYYILSAQRVPYDMVSPFVDEAEARAYGAEMEATLFKRVREQVPKPGSYFSERDMLIIAQKVAEASFDYSFQTGLVLGELAHDHSKKTDKKYKFILGCNNTIVPFETYAMHYGASREKHFSPPNDLNHYDAIHAEVELLIDAQKSGRDLHGKSIFINLMPCPPCARMLADTDIEEVVYSIDHSDGYAIRMLEAAGKKVRRIVP